MCSFVNQRLVPGWADAEAVVAGFKAMPGITYTGLWFNANGLERALAFRDKLTGMGATPVGGTPEEFGAILVKENAKWAKAIKDANIKIQ